MSLLAAGSLARRELVRFFRQPGRVIGALGSPLLFWLVIGSGLSGVFRYPGAPDATSPDGAEGVGYLAYFYPGIIVLVLLFTAIFASISVIEDRREGFLQGVLVAPIPPWSLVLGKVLGGGAIAWLQGVLLVALAPMAGLRFGWSEAVGAIGVLALLAIALAATGFAFAWRVDSVQGFHAVMNLVLTPAWLLSGAVFPIAGVPAWMAWMMRLNPLTYGVSALRASLGAGDPAAHAPGVTGLAITAGFTALALLAAVAVVFRRRS